MTSPPVLPLPISFQDLVEKSASEISGLLRQLILRDASLIDTRAVTSMGTVIVATRAPFEWPPLDDEGHQLQSRIYEKYNRFSRLLLSLFRGQPRKTSDRFHEEQNLILNVIHRDHVEFAQSSDVFVAVEHALRAQAALVRRIPSAIEGRLIIVPDTNALYFNPALEGWKHPNGDQFAIALTPWVINELDSHKDNVRESARRTKAARLIRQIGEYRRRGRLVDGVTLVRDVSTIFAISTDAQPQDFGLSGFSMDDLIFAAALEVMRLNPRAPMVIVTRDENLRNKVEVAGFTSWLPSEFVAESKQTAAPKRKGSG